MRFNLSTLLLIACVIIDVVLAYATIRLIVLFVRAIRHRATSMTAAERMRAEMQGAPTRSPKFYGICATAGIGVIALLTWFIFNRLQ